MCTPSRTEGRLISWLRRTSQFLWTLISGGSSSNSPNPGASSPTSRFNQITTQIRSRYNRINYWWISGLAEFDFARIGLDDVIVDSWEWHVHADGRGGLRSGRDHPVLHVSAQKCSAVAHRQRCLSCETVLVFKCFRNTFQPSKFNTAQYFCVTLILIFTIFPT